MTAVLTISDIPTPICGQIETVFTDIDDTLSTHGRIPAAAYSALWRLHHAGIRVIPVTGRPAGWCDMVARMWPVDAVVGENGALAYAMVPDPNGGPPTMEKLYADRPVDSSERLKAIEAQVLAEVPGCRVASDQQFRMFDLAIDFCEEVPHVGDDAIDHIASVFRLHGATAKISSIHVNGWFGEFDKLTMCRRAFETFFGAPLNPRIATFVGDSPNDEPMFRFFPHAVGVANIRDFENRMEALPAYVTSARGGMGFAEFVDILLNRL